MKTVIELLHEGARTWNDMPCLGEKVGRDWSTVSFLEVEKLSLAFAASLVSRGFKKGDSIAILSEGRVSWIVGEFGILKAGCVPVPLSEDLSPREIRACIDQSGARAILVSENCFRHIPGLVTGRPFTVICISPETDSLRQMAERSGFIEGKSLLFYRALLLEGQKALDTKPIAAGNAFGGKPLVWIMREIEKDIHENDAAAISFETFPDGTVRGIMLSHRGFWRNAREGTAIARPEAGWKALLLMQAHRAFAHTAGIHAALVSGLALYFASPHDRRAIPLRDSSHAISEVAPDIILADSSILEAYAEKADACARERGSPIRTIYANGMRAGVARAGNGFDKVPLGTRLGNFFPWKAADLVAFPRVRAGLGKNLKCCVCDGPPLRMDRQEFFAAAGVPVLQGYGLPERAPIISVNTLERHKRGTAGTAFPGTEVRVMKDAETECRRGEIGRIAAKGDSIMKGRVRRSPLDDEAMESRDGFLLTDDMGFIDDDGFLVLAGKVADEAAGIAEFFAQPEKTSS